MRLPSHKTCMSPSCSILFSFLQVTDTAIFHARKDITECFAFAPQLVSKLIHVLVILCRPQMMIISSFFKCTFISNPLSDLDLFHVEGCDSNKTFAFDFDFVSGADLGRYFCYSHFIAFILMLYQLDSYHSSGLRLHISSTLRPPLFLNRQPLIFYFFCSFTCHITTFPTFSSHTPHITHSYSQKAPKDTYCSSPSCANCARYVSNSRCGYCYERLNSQGTYEECKYAHFNAITDYSNVFG